MSELWWTDETDLDKYQREIIDLPIGGSHVIVGPPGSGKTNLLLLRANYVYHAGYDNIWILTFNRTLRDFIAFGGGEYSFPSDKIVTSMRFLIGVLREFGRHEDLPSSFTELRAEITSRMKALIASKQAAKYCDVIFLDEAQDYSPDEIDVFQAIADDVYAVADSRQMIYSGVDPLAHLKTRIPNVHTLRFHYRCGLHICELADGLAKHQGEHEPLVNTCNYDEVARPSSVTVQPHSTLEEACVRIAGELSTQLKSYPKELLGVLCPLKDDAEQVFEILADDAHIGEFCMCLREQGGTSFSTDRPICIGNIHAAKGVEFRAVHIAGTGGLKKFPRNRNMSFTAVTRAKTTLSIHVVDDLPAYFQTALTPKKKKRVNVSDIFGGRSS